MALWLSTDNRNRDDVEDELGDAVRLLRIENKRLREVIRKACEAGVQGAWHVVIAEIEDKK